MNYNHLHYFYMVVRNGSVSAASRFLNVSQPALSSQVKAFEESLGVKLFERRGNKLELTPAGRNVYSSAAEMFELSANIVDIATRSKNQSLPIHLGIADEVERPFAVNLVKLLFNQWKRTEPPRISFSTGHNDLLLGQLRNWSLDAVVTNRPSAFSDLDIADSLVTHVFFAMAGQPEFNEKHAINCQGKDLAKIIEAVGKGLSLPSGRLKLREEIDEFLTKLRVSAPIAFESDTLTTIIRVINDNVGVGFLPLAYMTREVLRKDILVCGPPDGFWKHTVFLMIKNGRSDAPGVAEIIQAFSVLKEFVIAQTQKVQFFGSAEGLLKALKK